MAANKIELSFLRHTDITFKIQEMALSGMEVDPPALTANTIEVIQGQMATQQILVTDSGSTDHSYSIIEEATYGEAHVNASGEISYTANISYEGPDFIIIEVRNHKGFAQLLRVSINISAQSR